MNILLKISWRNIWRNPRRSWVLITSIAVGIFGYMGTSAFSRGFLVQMVESTINLHGGHVTIAAKGYHENPNIRLFIRNPEHVEQFLNEINGVHYAPLVSFSGMINSTEKAAGVMIHGVSPEQESHITVISQSIVEGNYLSERENQILLGKGLAEKLNVQIGEKVVLMTSDLNKDISSGAYRISGLFETTSPDFDKTSVYLNQTAAQSLAGYTNQITAFNIKVDETPELESIIQTIKSNVQGKKLEVLSWGDRNRLLVLALELYDYSVIIIVVILFVAIAFSIANSFLMVIYERIHELGIMMANGVFPRKIRFMLYIEAFFITLIGSGFGYGISVAVFGYLSRVGLDLSAFAAGIGKFGVGSILYPKIVAMDFILGLVLINLIVFLSVLWPSIKASRFEVADAIRFD